MYALLKDQTPPSQYHNRKINRNSSFQHFSNVKKLVELVRLMGHSQ